MVGYKGGGGGGASNQSHQRKNHEDSAILMNVRENDRLQQHINFLKHTQKADLRRKELDQKLIWQKYGYLFKVPAHTDSHLRRSAIDRFRNSDEKRQYSKDTQIYSNLVSSNKSLFDSLHSINSCSDSLGADDSTLQRSLQPAGKKSLVAPDERSCYSCHDTIWEKVLVGSAKHRHYAMLQKKRQEAMLENLKYKQAQLQREQVDYFKRVVHLVPGGDTSTKSKSKINSVADILFLIKHNMTGELGSFGGGRGFLGAMGGASQQRGGKNRWKKAVKTIKVDSYNIDKKDIIDLLRS